MTNSSPNESNKIAGAILSENDISVDSISSLPATSKKSWFSIFDEQTFFWAMAATIIALIVLSLFLAFRLSSTVSKVQTLEEVTTRNSRQLANLNDLLGKTLDLPKEDDLSFAPLSVKRSLEFFKHLNELITSLDRLSFTGQPNTPTEKPVVTEPVREEKKHISANPEMRWWGVVFRNIISPIRNYFYELVHIQVIDAPVTELAMTANSQILLKKELVLRLLTVRELFLHGLTQEAVTETKAIHAISAKNLNPNDGSVAKFLNDLDELTVELEKNSFQPMQNSLKEK